MGTRSLTIINDGDNNDEEICTMYKQYDGYLDGHGQDLIDFCKPFEIVNGFGRSENKQANGAGCFAAQLIAHFKTAIGNVYIYPANTKDVGEDYIYSLSIKSYSPIRLTVSSFGNIIFDDDITNWNLEEIERNIED